MERKKGAIFLDEWQRKKNLFQFSFALANNSPKSDNAFSKRSRRLNVLKYPFSIDQKHSKCFHLVFMFMSHSFLVAFAHVYSIFNDLDVQWLVKSWWWTKSTLERYKHTGDKAIKACKNKHNSMKQRKKLSLENLLSHTHTHKGQWGEKRLCKWCTLERRSSITWQFH